MKFFLLLALLLCWYTFGHPHGVVMSTATHTLEMAVRTATRVAHVCVAVRPAALFAAGTHWD